MLVSFALTMSLAFSNHSTLSIHSFDDHGDIFAVRYYTNTVYLTYTDFQPSSFMHFKPNFSL